MGKSILVTGGAGYIGSHAVRELLKKKYQVAVVDNLSKGFKQAVAKEAQFMQMDLADSEGLKALFRQYSFDAVMHFAGSIEVGQSMKEPALYFRNNCENGFNLLEAMRDAGVKNIIFSSTAAVYGAPKEMPINENAVLAPTNFYGQSKLIFEQLLKSYHDFFGFNYIALRYFNACGADISGEIGQDYRPDTHLIPRLLKAALGIYDKFNIYGTDYPTADGTCIRDYIHVTDLVDAHLLALDSLFSRNQSNIFNLGNGNGFSVREVINKAEEVIGQKIKVTESARRPGDPAVLVADASKAQKELGWKTKYSDLETIIKSSWKWHSGHLKGYLE
jgi:UDP-glucose 4-epimerase